MKKDLYVSFRDFIVRFSEALSNGTLGNASEETVRSWINEMLRIFGWDVQNTNQILQERTLDKASKKKLHEIGSTNTRPDYTLVNGNVQLAFLDAKSLDVNIEEDKSVAFQIRSYGWSIGASFSIVTNMRELAVYDCKPKPNVGDGAKFARVLYLTYDDYLDNLDKLVDFLLREIVITNKSYYFSTSGNSVDEEFAKLLSSFRLSLIKSILEENTNVNIEAPLTLWAQIIIDRILFIRVCEARGLEQDRLLQKFAEEGFWNKFKESSYCDFYNHYDGPLFKRIQQIHDLHISDEIFSEILNVLYYPSPYKFDVIPLKTISDIYDKFLGYTVEVIHSDISLKLKEEYRKSKGAVTTPQPIVEKVLNIGINREVISSYSIDDILNLRIVDPACGSGVFLAGAFDLLSDVILDKANRGGNIPPDFYIKHNGETFLTIKGKKAIIQNCIFGVDIDQEAVEVAKMSLSLKVIDKYTPSSFSQAGVLGSQILNGIGENIKCGNSLVSEDICLFKSEFVQNTEEIKRTRIFNWEKSFPTVFNRKRKKKGFDFVVGNPPYVEVKNYNSGLPTMAEYIKHTYPCSHKGKIDLSIPFIEKGVSLLNESGTLSFVVQKRFFKTEYGKVIRDYLSVKNLVQTIYEYSETDLFAGKITYVAILALQKGLGKTSDFLYGNTDTNGLLPISKSLLANSSWAFDNIELTKLSNKLTRALGSLGDAYPVLVGIQVLWVKAYHIKVRKIKNGIIYGFSSLDENVMVEEKACREIICNEKFHPYGSESYRTFAIFPYKVNNGSAQRIPFSEYATDFPKAAEYLIKHKKEITDNVQTQPERDQNLSAEEYWHIFTRAQNLEKETPKVVIPMTTYYPQAAIISKTGTYCDNANVNYIPFTEIGGDAYALCAIINSRLFGILAKSQANPSSGGYAKYNKEFLKHVPFPVELIKDPSNPDLIELIQFSKEIEKLYQERDKCHGSDKDSLNPVISALWNKIDTLVYKIYGLSHEEIKLISEQNYYER